jgi:hypothetical protein
MHVRPRRMQHAALVLLAGVAFGACSSSSSTGSHAAPLPTTTSTTAPVTEAAFTAAVSNVCAASNRALGAAATQAFGDQQPTADRWRPFMVDTALPLVEKRLQAIASISAPVADAAKVRAIVDAGHAAIASAKQNPAQLSPETRAPFEHFDDLVTAAGFSQCAVGG